MKIAILLYPGVTALDAIGPYEVLSRIPGATVHFVAKTVDPIVTDTGMLTLLPELAIAELTQPEVLLIPGSLTGTQAAMADEAHRSWIRFAHQTTRWTTSVCSGALVLGAAGILNGLEATTHWFAASMLGRTGATYTEKRVVTQGKVITAAGVSAGIDMGLTLAAEIAGRKRAEGIQLLIEYDPEPPFNSGSPSKASKSVLNRVKREVLIANAKASVQKVLQSPAATRVTELAKRFRLNLADSFTGDAK